MPTEQPTITFAELLETPRIKAENEQKSREEDMEFNRRILLEQGKPSYTPEQLAQIEMRMDRCPSPELASTWDERVTLEYLAR